MEPDTELSLVSRLRAGEPSAFDEVHSAFNARLFSFLVRLSRRRDIAEDLLEETWLRLVTHAERLRPDTRLAPWLFTVARNLYISHQRSRALEESHAGCLLGLWPFGTPRSSPFEQTAANEVERRIESALAALPVQYREVLLLVGVEGFRPSEAAALCGISPEALRQRLCRARTLLAQRMDTTTTEAARALREVTI